METDITVETILEAMKSPGTLTPRQVVEYYAYLSAIYAEQHTEASRLKALMANKMAIVVGEGESAAKAKIVAEGTLDGQAYITIIGRLTGLEEAIRSLKRMQAFYSEEARNQY